MSAGNGATGPPYPPRFQPYLAPAWLDHVALLGGFAPPDRAGRPFTWCDLGCGRGVSAAVLAATHADGRFVGLDLDAGHIAGARALARDAGLGTVQFDVADLVHPVERPERFDYIVCHGVLSWVDEPVRSGLRRFVDRHLAPGGLFYVSYNAMPGRLRDMPFQRVVSALGTALSDDRLVGFERAMTLARRLADGGVPSLAGSRVLDEIFAKPEAYEPAYLLHEFMTEHWQPLWVTDVRRSLAAIGLVPVGSATLIDNYDEFVVRPEGRAILADIGDPDLRELLRDCLRDTVFRRDVFARKARRIDAAERQNRLCASCYALTGPAETMAYAADTPAGRLAYDVPGIRAAVTALAAGRATLVEIASRSGAALDAVLAAALILTAMESIRPVEADATQTRAINGSLRRASIEQAVLACGTAVPLGNRWETGPQAAAMRAYLRIHEAQGIAGVAD